MTEDELNATDRRIAFGMGLNPITSFDGKGFYLSGDILPSGSARYGEFSPIRNRADAMEVLEWLAAWREHYDICLYKSAETWCIFMRDPNGEVYIEKSFATTLPLAICKFAEKVMEKGEK